MDIIINIIVVIIEMTQAVKQLLGQLPRPIIIIIVIVIIIVKSNIIIITLNIMIIIFGLHRR